MTTLHIKQGDDWELDLIYEDSEQNPIDIESDSLLFQIRKTPQSTLVEELSTDKEDIIISNQNEIKLMLDSERTSLLPIGSFLFDLQLTQIINNKVTTLMSGTVNILPDIAYVEQTDNQTEKD